MERRVVGVQSKPETRNALLVAAGAVVAVAVMGVAVVAIVLAFKGRSLLAWIDFPELFDVTDNVLVDYLPLTVGGVLLFGVVFALERIIPVHRTSRTAGRAVREDMLWMLLAAPVTIFSTFWFSRGLQWVFDHPLDGLSVDLTDYLPFAVVFGICFVLGDFLGWCAHFAKHKIPLLWRFHAVHHSAIDLSLFTDSRVHVGEYLINRLFAILPFFVIGGDATITVPLFVLGRLWYARFLHSNARTHLGPLRHVLVTPQYHRMHHSIEPDDIDMNYAPTLVIWDRIFGTQVKDWDRYPLTGINDSNFPHAKSRHPFAVLRAYWQQTLYPIRPPAPKFAASESQ